MPARKQVGRLFTPPACLVNVVGEVQQCMGCMLCRVLGKLARGTHCLCEEGCTARKAPKSSQLSAQARGETVWCANWHTRQPLVLQFCYTWRGL